MVVVDRATPSAVRHRWAWVSDPQFWSPSKEKKNEKALRWHSGRPPGPSRSAGAGGGGQKKPKKPRGSEGTLVAPGHLTRWRCHTRNATLSPAGTRPRGGQGACKVPPLLLPGRDTMENEENMLESTPRPSPHACPLARHRPLPSVRAGGLQGHVSQVLW